MLRESILKVLKEYVKAKSDIFSNHQLASFIRNDFPSVLSSLLQDKIKYVVKGSAGQGQWTDCPWIATLNTIITNTPQEGYYVVYLFPENMKGVYLSLNQGITSLKETYGFEAKTVLKSQAALFRSQLAPLPITHTLANIDLSPSASFSRSSFYQYGNITAVFYPLDSMPTEEVLISDYTQMLTLYEKLTYYHYHQAASKEMIKIAELKEDYLVEDLTLMKLHESIERNNKLANQAKQYLGYTCQACGFKFSDIYGSIGDDFIEAHHLVPLSQLKGKIIPLNPQIDFAVLCSNCHSMIHKFSEPHNIQLFKSLLQSN